MRRSTRVLTGAGLASIVAQSGRRGIIKSVQRGTITMTSVASNTATITTVDLNNCTIHFLGSTNDDTGVTTSTHTTRVALTNATTVTATAGVAVGGVTNVVSYEVIEYYPGVIKSVQRGTILSTTTATITAVDVTKSRCDYLGATGGASNATGHSNVVLTNSTTVTGTAATSGSSTVGYQVVEFY